MSEKKKDDKNRWRNKTIAFRGSPEEAVELDKRWKLCGYATKQDYLIDSMLHQQVVAKGNPMMLVTFRDVRLLLAAIWMKGSAVVFICYGKLFEIILLKDLADTKLLT